MIERAAVGAGIELKAHPTCFAMPAAMRSPTRGTTRGQFRDGSGIARSQHSGLYGPGTEPIQGFLARVSRYSAGFLRIGVGLTL
jgi:hypothetical protein